MAHTTPEPGAGGQGGGRRPRSQDPRSIITPDAFHVEASLLGAPLASPSRRFAAMVIDLVLLGFLVNAPGWLFALLTAVVLFRATSRKSGAKGGAGRFFLRATGTVIAFIGVLSLLGAVSGLFSGGDRAPAGRADRVGEASDTEAPRGLPAGESDSEGEVDEAGPADAAASSAAVGADLAGRAAGPAGGDSARLGPVPTTGEVLGELFALGRARSPEAARPHAAAVARYFAAQGERIDDPEELREALRGIGDLPLLSIDVDVFPVIEDEFRKAGFLSPGSDVDVAARAEAVDSLLRGRDEALSADDGEEADRLTREAGLLMAADTIGRLRSRVSSLRGDVESLEDRVDAAERSAQRSPLGLLMDLVADEIGVSAGWAALYFTAMLALWRGRTPGKRALGIRVIRLDGKPLGWFASFERFGGYAAALATGTLGFFQILWDRNRQGVHDKISETVVIRDLRPEHVVRTRVSTT